LTSAAANQALILGQECNTRIVISKPAGAAWACFYRGLSSRIRLFGFYESNGEFHILKCVLGQKILNLFLNFFVLLSLRSVAPASGAASSPERLATAFSDVLGSPSPLAKLLLIVFASSFLVSRDSIPTGCLFRRILRRR